MIKLHPDHLKIVQDILQRHVPNSRVIAFGSRVKGKVKEYSDLDLCVLGDKILTLKQLADLRNDFSESDLPIRVDIVDWLVLDPSFKKIICIRQSVFHENGSRDNTPNGI